MAPVLVLMAGTPLSGKSTLARGLRDAADAPVVLVENDAVRAELFDEPAYTNQENHATYREAVRRVEAALADGYPVIHDATNLKEKWRRDAYDTADRIGAPVGIVFVLTDPAVNEARARALPPARQAAWAHLGGKRPNPDACRKPHRVVDGTRPVAENVRALAAWSLLEPFRLPRAPDG